MKSIYLLRHAKSDWDANYGSDHDRPLNSRGRQAAVTMGRHLGGSVPQPDRILCSTAIRTRETLALVERTAEWTAPIVYTPELYLASLKTVIACIRGLPDESDCVMLVGHQPTTGDIASWLIGRSSIEVPTGTFIHIKMELLDWKDLEKGAAKLVGHIMPKKIKK